MTKKEFNREREGGREGGERERDIKCYISRIVLYFSIFY